MEETYTKGMKLKCMRQIRKKDIINLCELLNENIKINKFEPEPISEGGIIYKWKNDNSELYKSVRFNCRNWEYINNDVMNAWKDNNDILFDEQDTFNTFLKSFNGAPIFTINELNIWENCFEIIGIKVIKKYYSSYTLMN